MAFSLRTRLTLLSLLLLFIPLAGIRFAGLIHQDLLKSQEETMLFSAKAVAAALGGRSGLLDRESFRSLDPHRDLYLYPLHTPIRLNGKADDWSELAEETEWYGQNRLLADAPDYTESSLSYRLRTGTYGHYFYGLVEVRDDRIIPWPRSSLNPSRNDHLEITIEKTTGEQQRFVIATREDGWVNGYLRNPDGTYHLETRIQGVWRTTDDGYILELRMPESMLGERLGIVVADVDDPLTRKIRYRVGTGGGTNSQPGRLLGASATIEQILKTLNRPSSRITIVDTNHRIRARYGSIGSQEAGPRQVFEPDVLPEPVSGEEIDSGLAGAELITTRVDEEGQPVMQAIVPLLENDEVVGVVMVEQSTDKILAIGSKLIEESLLYTLGAFAIGGGGIFWFAFRLSARIRQLQARSSEAIGKNGEIRQTIDPGRPGERPRDELEELARSLGQMLSRLRSQSEYRERMADTLEHEMRTPLAGIGAALQNLDRELTEAPAHIRDYLSCARTDIARLEDLLGTVREATSLKQALSQDQKELFPLDEAISMWLSHGWQGAFPECNITYRRPESPISFYGDPARIRQLLDKLVENGVSFAAPGTEVEIALMQDQSTAIIAVTNQGEPIGEEQRQQIFDSMVSLRPKGSGRPHLGLGLYVVRTIVEQYGGTINVSSSGRKEGGNGTTVFSIQLPKHPPPSLA